ncbi:MAG: hypothetical protein PUB49_03410 [Selenomonadaceae bacterium]|nr:hypothetical protein [Selenomonadaceae bacterium]
MIPWEEKLSIWRGMPTETAEEILWADNYYREELVPLALKRFAKRYENKQFPDYYGMILLLGSSWEDLAFNVGLLSPRADDPHRIGAALPGAVTKDKG